MTNTKILLLLIISIFLSCSEEEKETPLPDPVIESSEKELISFKFTIDEQNYEAEIRNDSILAVLPSSTDLTKLTPKITISEKATINPASGVLQDFTNLINYNVIAEDNSSKLYKAIITKLNSENKINTFSFTNLAEGQASYSLLNNNLADIDTISYRVPYLSPIKELISNISISTNATISPQSGETLGYSIPVKYTVTAEDNTIKDYLVIVDNSLGQLDIDGILGNDYRNKKPTESISFFTNVLNPIKDSIQVKLVSTDDLVNYNLEVQNVNYDNNEVSVKLPDSYNNNSYRFKVFIEHDNFDESDGFTLDGGTPNFKQVDDDYDNGNYNVYNTLLLPGERFTASVFINRDNFNNHNFYLRKNGQDYPFSNAELDANFSKVRFVMPNLSSSNLESGTDFEFLIKYEGQEHSFPLLNSINSPIECVVAKPPIINSVSSTTIIKGGELTVFGSNLYFSYFNGDNTIINQSSQLEIKKGGTTNYLSQMDLNNDGSISFNISDDIKSGTYNLAFKNNIESFEKVEINSMLTIELPNSNHPSLIVTEAKIYSNTDQNTPKQILITFNGNIGNIEIKEIKIGSSFPSIIIGNYLTYTSTILTNALSDNDFSNFYYGSNLHDGYVIIEDGGVEYKLPFKLTR